MIRASKHDDRTRQNLRLDKHVWAAIDIARLKRAGNVSRNTWITEAVLEKIARESAEYDNPERGGPDV